jgi:tetratricopeptide (TPR) repeat protein
VTPIILALLAATAQAGPSDSTRAQFRSCTALIKQSPDKAIAAADAWRLKGGGLEARQCLGLAYSAAERWAAAAAAFDQAAREAETKKDASSGDFWVQSGNAWLAGGNPANAVKAFDTSTLQAELRGEVHLDRARADVALADLAGARADMDKGLALVPGDPLGWYLSAALARRQRDLPRARTDIAKALELAPAEASILLEAGNIAGLSGDLPAARAHYARAAQSDPQGPTGRAAAAALAANGSEEAPTTAAAAPQGR